MNRLQQLREAAGMSRADLSRRSDVTVDVIEQFEAGENVTEADAAVIIPGETTVQDRAVLLNHLADALNGELIARGMSVEADELLQPANDNLPVSAEAYAEPGEETLTAIPLIGVNFPTPEELPAEAKSHNTAEQPDDIDAALDQLAINAQVTASEEAARLQPETDPVSAAPVATTEDLSASARFAESPQAVTTPAAPSPSMAVTSAEPVVVQETATPEMPETVAKPEMPDTTQQPEITTSDPAPAPDTYEPVPGPDMPGPAPAPETMEIESDAKPEPPVSTTVEEDAASDFKVVTDVTKIEPAEPVSEATLEPPATETTPEPADISGNLGITTGDEIEEIIPEPPALPPVATAPAPVEAKETAKPVEDVAPLTTPAPDNQPPVMKPYVSPQPTDATKSRYKLPTGTVVTTIAGVGAAVVFYVWRSWRRSKAESERVAPYYRKK